MYNPNQNSGRPPFVPEAVFHEQKASQRVKSGCVVIEPMVKGQNPAEETVLVGKKKSADLLKLKRALINPKFKRYFPPLTYWREYANGMTINARGQEYARWKELEEAIRSVLTNDFVFVVKELT